MTVEELLNLLSPTTLVNLLIDLDHAGEQTPEEARVSHMANRKLLAVFSCSERTALYGSEKERRQNVVRPVR